MRFLVDANLSPKVAAQLRSAGHDVTHVGDEGLLTADDETILARASESSRRVGCRLRGEPRHPHLMVPVRTLAAMRALRPRVERWADALAGLTDHTS